MKALLATAATATLLVAGCGSGEPAGADTPTTPAATPTPTSAPTVSPTPTPTPSPSKTPASGPARCTVTLTQGRYEVRALNKGAQFESGDGYFGFSCGGGLWLYIQELTRTYLLVTFKGSVRTIGLRKPVVFANYRISARPKKGDYPVFDVVHQR